MESEPGADGPTVQERACTSYDAAVSVSWPPFTAASTILAATVLARRLILADPVPISTPFTVGANCQQDHLHIVLGSLTFESRGPQGVMFRTAGNVHPAPRRGLHFLQIYEGGD